MGSSKSTTYPTTYLRSLVADRVSAVSRYCDELVQWLPHPWDSGELLELCD